MYFGYAKKKRDFKICYILVLFVSFLPKLFIAGELFIVEWF